MVVTLVYSSRTPTFILSGMPAEAEFAMDIDIAGIGILDHLGIGAHDIG